MSTDSEDTDSRESDDVSDEVPSGEDTTPSEDGPPDDAQSPDSEDTADWLRSLASPDESLVQSPAGPPLASPPPVAAERKRVRANALTWLIVAVALIAAGAALVATSYYAGDPESGETASSNETASTPTTPSAGKGSVEDSAAFLPGGSAGVPATTSPDAGAGRPTEPARDGAALDVVAVAPEKTLTLVNLPEGVSEVAYAVAFQPFGWGPGGQDGGRLVVRITEAEPQGEVPSDVAELAGRNASVWAEPAAARAVTGGGTYRGIIVVRSQADVGLLILQQAEAVR